MGVKFSKSYSYKSQAKFCKTCSPNGPHETTLGIVANFFEFLILNDFFFQISNSPRYPQKPQYLEKKRLLSEME